MSIDYNSASRMVAWAVVLLSIAELAATIFHEGSKSRYSRRLLFSVLALTGIIAFVSLELNVIKDEVAEREKVVNSLRITTLKAETAKAVKEAESLKKANLQLRRDFEITSALEQQKLLDMKIDVAAARGKQAEAEKSLEMVKEKLRPRILSPTQRVGIIESLASAPAATIEIEVLNGDTEAENYAKQLEDVIKNAGWTVSSFFYGFGVSHPVGTKLLVKRKLSPPAHASVLQNALEHAGINAPALEAPRLGDKDVTIFVGKKP